jgi:hypothetical protein
VSNPHDLVGAQGHGEFLGVVFDAVDIADGIGGDGAVADGKSHDAGHDASTGSGCGGAGAGLDLGDGSADSRGVGFADA